MITFGLEDSEAVLAICDEQRYRAVADLAPALADGAVIARPADPEDSHSWERSR